MGKTVISHNQTYDVLGISLSVLCGIHCLVTPLAILYAPSLSEGLESTWFHGLLIGLVIWTFYRSIYLHYKFHRSKIVLSTGVLGFVILLSTYIVELFAHAHKEGHGDGHHEEGIMLYVTLIGAILLIGSHLLNIRKCKCLTSNSVCSEDTKTC